MRFAILALLVACASHRPHSTAISAGPFQGFAFKQDYSDTRELSTSGIFVKRAVGWRVPYGGNPRYRTVLVDLENRTKRLMCVEMELEDTKGLKTWYAPEVLKLKPRALARHIAGRVADDPQVARVELHWLMLDAWFAHASGSCDPKPQSQSALLLR